VSLPLTDDFRSIVLENRPLIDVRAPVEFKNGAFPHTVNLPLMNDEERRLVGIRYKQAGNEKAVELGEKLVGPYKNERLARWKAFIELHPEAYLYCFRGGQRSQISQRWLHDSGVIIPRLKGGYKAFRHFLMNESERIAAKSNTLIIGGRTGSGKTLLLHKLENAIDLEGLANHRGSSFGNHITEQPTQISFEDALAYALIHHETKHGDHLVIEHESQSIGHIHIPKPIFENFKKGKLIILNTPIQERVQITFDEYVSTALLLYESHFNEKGAYIWSENIKKGLDRIKRRLGGERHRQITTLFLNAFQTQLQTGKTESHKHWIQILLESYYDPMYDYQIEKTALPIVFRGNKKDVLRFINTYEKKS